jgi:CHAT domain
VTAIEVTIGPGDPDGSWRVEVLQSPAGEAEAAVVLDVVSLLRRRGQLEQAVLASASAGRLVLPEAEGYVRQVGQALFTALLGTGEVAGRYRASAALAAERQEALRVVLRIGTPRLACLPWEAMYDGSSQSYVCREHQLVRHVPVASVPAPLIARPPLRILGVVSAPRGLAPLDVRKEQRQLKQALRKLHTDRLVELCWVHAATWASLQDLLLGQEWHVVHFIGHGQFDSKLNEGRLALLGDDAGADWVEAGRLVDLLRQARPMPRLVVLSTCSGATTGAQDLFSGTATALVRGGISSVVAMQYPISDAAAAAFARGFYAAISRGRGVDDATTSGRVAILGAGAQTMEWITPVTYLRGQNSRLLPDQPPLVRSLR